MNEYTSIRLQSVNDQCYEKFAVMEMGEDYFQLIDTRNSDVVITEGDSNHIEKRIKQIARENGVSVDWPVNYLQFSRIFDELTPTPTE